MLLILARSMNWSHKICSFRNCWSINWVIWTVKVNKLTNLPLNQSLNHHSESAMSINSTIRPNSKATNLKILTKSINKAKHLHKLSANSFCLHNCMEKMSIWSIWSALRRYSSLWGILNKKIRRKWATFYQLGLSISVSLIKIVRLRAIN